MYKIVVLKSTILVALRCTFLLLKVALKTYESRNFACTHSTMVQCALILNSLSTFFHIFPTQYKELFLDWYNLNIRWAELSYVEVFCGKRGKWSDKHYHPSVKQLFTLFSVAHNYFLNKRCVDLFIIQRSMKPAFELKHFPGPFNI